MVDEKKIETLRENAESMLDSAYVPYSEFPVGASLLTKEGKLFNGCNIENASFGLSMCAERTAMFKAVSEGHKDFSYFVVTADTDEPVSPCGACRQVMADFFEPDMPVLLINKNGKTFETTVQGLLPGAFQSGDMD